MQSSVKSLVGIAAIASLLLAGCGGGGGGSSVPAVSVPQTGGSNSQPPPVPSTGASQTTVANYGAVAMQGASLIGPAQFGTMDLDLYLKPANASGLMAYAKAVSDPSSPRYRQFITPQQIGDQYGATQAQYNTVATYLTQNGVSVAGWPQRLMMHVTGTQKSLETSLGVKFGVYSRGGSSNFVAPMSAPKISSQLAIAGIGKIVHVTPQHTFLVPAPRSGNGTNVGYSPQQVATAFDFAGAYRAGFTGKGITIGIIGTGPINEGYPSLGAGDVEEMAAYYHTPNAPVKIRAATNAIFPASTPPPSACLAQPSIAFVCNYSGGLQTPPPPTAPCDTTKNPLPACNPEDVEAQLDTETTALLAPGAAVQFYLAYNPNECFFEGNYTSGSTCPNTGSQPFAAIGIALTDDEIQQAIADNTADVLSLSFGLGDLDGLNYYYDSTGNGFGPVEFAALAAEGIAVFVSSGDDGATACRRDFGPSGPNANAYCVAYPAEDASVTSVGGVNVGINNAGQIIDTMTAWGYQTTGGGTAGGFAGSTGGFGAYIGLPSWQTGPGVTGTLRNQPDIAAIADSNTGYTIVANSGPALGGRIIEPVGGTSLAAPASAAQWALVLQACAATAACATASGGHPYRLGNAAPLFYKIYNNAAAYSSTIYDVVYGNNGAPGLASPFPAGSPAPNINGYPATTGYDLITGVGVPYTRALIKAVVGV